MKKVNSRNLIAKVFGGGAIFLMAWAMVRLIFMPGIIAGTTGIVVSLLLSDLFGFLAWRCWQDSVTKLPSPLLAKEAEDTAGTTVTADRPAPSVTFSFDDLDPADRVSLEKAQKVAEDYLSDIGTRMRAYIEMDEKLKEVQDERKKLLDEARKAIL